VRLPLKATNPMEWEERNSGNGDFVNNVVHTNVHMTIDKIFKDSDIIREMTAATGKNHQITSIIYFLINNNSFF
jgi:hypothetical protein